MPYFYFIKQTRLNYLPITRRSSLKAHWELYTQVHCVLTSGVLAINLSSQFLPTGFPPHSTSSLLTISYTIFLVSKKPLKSRSRMRSTIADSSRSVSFIQSAGKSRHDVIPVRWSLRVLRGTSYS